MLEGESRNFFVKSFHLKLLTLSGLVLLLVLSFNVNGSWICVRAVCNTLGECVSGVSLCRCIKKGDNLSV